MTQKLYFQKYTVEKLLDNCTKGPVSDIYKGLVIIATNANIINIFPVEKRVNKLW